MILILAQMLTGLNAANAYLVEKEYATRQQAYDASKQYYLICLNAGIEPTYIRESSNQYFYFSCANIDYRMYFQYNSIIEEKEDFQALENSGGLFWYLVGEIQLGLLTAISVPSFGDATNLCGEIISDHVAKHYLC